MTKHLLLIGGGHAHVAVLADWIKNGLPCERATLLTPSETLRYSGMVPGWIAGQYSRDEGIVDVAALARQAGAELVLDRCIAIDPEARSVLTQESGLIPFDTASIDVGGVGQAAKILGDDPRLHDVRPIESFVDRMAEEVAKQREGLLGVTVIGGGAGGFELAFALKNSSRFSSAPEVRIVLGEMLSGLSSFTQRKAIAEVVRQGIRYREGFASLASGELTVGHNPIEDADIIVAALGSGAPHWLRQGGLACDEAGFIAVDQFQRSTSHPHILAAGDCAQRMDREVPHSGVHAVHTGPVLASNLRAVAAGREPDRSYRPRSASLYLISTGDGSAIASYGPWAAQGRWVARLKHWIDNRWISKYAKLAKGG